MLNRSWRVSAGRAATAPPAATFTSVHNESTMSQMADEETPPIEAWLTERPGAELGDGVDVPVT